MARVKSRNTTPEKLLRRALRKAGMSFRTSNSKLPGKPDFAIRSKNLAVFIDGDFWHGRQWASASTLRSKISLLAVQPQAIG